MDDVKDLVERIQKAVVPEDYFGKIVGTDD